MRYTAVQAMAAPYPQYHHWGPCRPMTTSGTDLNSDGTGRWSGGRVLVLNATFEPINVCTVRRATVLLLKEKAEVIEIGATRPALGDGLAAAAGRDPARHLRPRPARHATSARSPAARCSRATAGSAVLRRPHAPDGRPRDPALQGRRVGLGQHRRLVRAVQPPQGRPAAAPGRTCTRASSRARPPRTSSSSSRRRRSRRRGSSTCRSLKRPDAARCWRAYAPPLPGIEHWAGRGRSARNSGR